MIRSVNPANGELIEEFAEASSADIARALERARSVQSEWAAQEWPDRTALFRRLGEQLQARLDEIVDLMGRETGKIRSDAEVEVFDSIDAIEYYIEQFNHLKAPSAPPPNQEGFPDTEVRIEYLPLGVIGLIMPWNFPVYTPLMAVITATMAGNGVLLKPSEYSTLTGMLIRSLFDEAGFPADLVQVVVGGDETGKALVRSGVDKIFFVGSVEGGKDVLRNAGTTPVQVELGGNSAAIVLDDADLDLAASGIGWAATYHSGQDCAGIKRIFVMESVADEFLEKLVAIIQSVRPGTDYGPYISEDAVRAAKERLDDAVAKGARLVCGGEVSTPGFWLSPAVVVYRDSSLSLVAQETFGNIAPVKVVSSVDEAVMEANQTDYGLSNAVFGRDLDRAGSVAERLESGMVFVNDPLLALPGLEHWTGWKDSGFGTPESRLEQALKKRLVSVNESGQPRSFWYHGGNVA